MRSRSYRSLALAALMAITSASVGCGQATPDTAAPAADAAPAATPALVKAGWTTTEGIDAPESVFADAASGFLYVSLIGGAPDARDGNGRIAKLNGDGSIVSTSWVTGLNAPKGLRACQGTLWAADIGELVGIDIATGTITSRVTVEGSQFLNDVACSDGGTVYVSDMLGNRIYEITAGTARIFAEGEQLEWPNGLLLDGGRMIVGGWGRPEADFTTKVPGRLFALDLKTKQKTLITPEPFANIDGVEADGRGGFLVTDWVAGRVLQIGSNGEARQLRTFAPGTADHAFLVPANVLIVPHMSENKVAAYDLSDVLK